MFKNALIISIITLGALTSNGSGRVTATGLIDQNRRPVPAVPTTEAVLEPGEEVREEFHQTYPLSATGRLSLENLNGAVQIKVWDRAAVQVDAVKRANRKERLDEAKIVVNATEEKIRISTEYPDRDKNWRDGRYDNPASIEYSLTVPRKVILESVELINGALDIDGVEGNVKASSINGRVTARGLAGETQLSTVNGSLQASFERLEESKDIYLQSVNGSLTLVIPSNANASVRASTVHGSITNDFGLQVRHGEYVGHDLDGQIGSGGPRIKLGNVNGGIRISHAQDGRALSPVVSNVKARNGSTDEAIAASVESAVESATAAANVRAETQITRAERARIARETRRQVDVALRQAQREVAQAQAEVQREVQRQVREEVRANARRGAGVGVGVGGGGSRFSVQESKTFAVSGVPRVNVGTFDGPITVHGWDKAEVMYTATKRAGDEEELKTISIQAEQQGGTISIIAKSTEESGSAQLDVWVPRQSSMHVSTGDGQLSLDGVNGDITLRTGDGEIQVTNGGGQCQVNTGDGRILVANFQGQLDARTGDGAISLDGNFNSLSARTGDGTISLAVPGASNFTIETNAENNVSNEGLTITEDVSPSQRVKRWKVGNGGRVFVLKTGEGTIFLRSNNR
jgi:DUF4097 and DUF4098 domain-containing protein YvlB